MFICSLHNTKDEQKPQNDNRCSQKQLLDESEFRKLLPPPNPILNRQVQGINEKASFRLESGKQKLGGVEIRLPQSKKQSPQSEQNSKRELFASKSMGKMTLTNGYQPSTMVFLKFDNKEMNKRGKTEYFSSLFLSPSSKGAIKLPDYKGMLCDEDLTFDASYQSSNLMAVYKVDKHTYDLILQNDINTKGFTQWFNFKVHNNINNFIAKFNIVNLYKTKSLYNQGMKPIVRSQLSQRTSKKSWKRKGFNIYYEKNDLHYQHDQTKFYKTLTFQYDFTVQKDTVQFAHGIPYDISDLKKLLEGIKGNPRVTLLTIGSTLTGRSIPLIKISTADTANTKKALIILGRQHPGETPGSFIGEEMILQLLKNTNEADFLLWRFDIFIFPMVNIDGVALGNYRGNFAGFDLNRCWLKPDPLKQPQVNVIKNYIKKISKKQQIELILDLHGHSRKMGSFFYGNDFGQNYMLFPFIAAKINRNILFQHSKFTRETENDAKFSTARVVLGNLIKDVGYVYTYQVSFFGHFKENSQTPFSFTQEHYKELGRSLVASIYRTFLEIQKEQKTLKQSVYLKSIKGYLSQIAEKSKREDSCQSGSDSQAQAEVAKQILQNQQFLNFALRQEEKMDFIKQEKGCQSATTKKSSKLEPSRDFKQLEKPIQRYNQQVKQKIEELLEKNMENGLRKVLDQRLPKLLQSQIKRHIKSQKIKGEDDNNASSMQIANIQTTSQEERTSLQQQMPITYIQYLKQKKHKKNFEESLKIYGATFQLQEKSKSLQSKDDSASKLKGKRQEPNFISQLKGKKVVQGPKEKDSTMKSFNTVDLIGQLHINRQERQLLLNERTHLQRRKKNLGYYMFRNNESSEIHIGSKSIDLDIVAQSVLKVNRQAIKIKLSKDSKLPQIVNSQQKIVGRIKLPII